MARYRPPIRRRAPSLGVIALQIAVLTLMLVALLSFKDVIGAGTTALVESLASEDVQVNVPAPSAPDDAPASPAKEAAPSPAPSADAGSDAEADSDLPRSPGGDLP